MQRILIVVDGGIIQDILADHECEILIKDYDTEGINEGLKIDTAGKEYYSRLLHPSDDGPLVDAIFRHDRKQG
jgi:hypothetical protein